MQYKKVHKSSWNEPYSSSSFTKQSCSKMALYRYYYFSVVAAVIETVMGFRPKQLL